MNVSHFFDILQFNLKNLKPNTTHYRTGQKEGHYESYFQRANHPTEPLAFWIRYTLFSPRKKPQDAIGEIWAIFFNGKTQKHIAVKEEFPLQNCHFKHRALDMKIGIATLIEGKLKGKASTNNNTIEWDLVYDGAEKPLYLLPISFYHLPLPKAKALVGLPLASYTGCLKINDTQIPVENWVGSQNHNWGTEHTDRYAWGQVAGFDNHPNSFLEIATAQVKLGWVHSPKLTVIVLRHNGKDYKFNDLKQSLKNKGNYTYFNWEFSAINGQDKLMGKIFAEQAQVMGLNYYNPPGGNKTCLNTKIATAELTLSHKDGTQEQFISTNRAAFEILTNDDNHGIQILNPIN